MIGLADPQVWASFLSLFTLEIVLGVDNLVFLALVAGQLPPNQRAAGRRAGLGLALLTRLALLGSIFWLANLTHPVFVVSGHPVSLRDLVLLGGGMFLLFKGAKEIRAEVHGTEKHTKTARKSPGFFGTIVQIALLDIVFSLDSVITAVGIARQVWVMIAAIILAMLVMLMASGKLAAFIESHASVKMLALAFILLIGGVLVAGGAGLHIPPGYIYAAMGFACLVEGLNSLRLRPHAAEQTSSDRRNEGLTSPPGRPAFGKR